MGFINHQKWVVYDIAIPTLDDFNDSHFSTGDYLSSLRLECVDNSLFVSNINSEWPIQVPQIIGFNVLQ